MSEAFTTRIDYAGGTNIVYFGKALSGTDEGITGWQIQKFSYTGNDLTKISFADDTSNFIKRWDDRTTYSYD